MLNNKNILNSLIKSAAFLTLIIPFSGCVKKTESEVQAFTNSELKSNYDSAHGKAKHAMNMLQKAGWCEIPDEYLNVQPMSRGAAKRKFSRIELMQYMGCVANQESTLGNEKDNAGSNSGDGMGYAIGMWQVKEGHRRKMLRMGGRVLQCDDNLYDDLNSATCALIVFIEAARERDMNYNGLNPWEGVCTEAQYKVTNPQGLPIFSPQCDDCQSSLKTNFSLNSDASKLKLEVTVDGNKCGAQDLKIEFINTDESKTKILQNESFKFSTAKNGGSKVAEIEISTNKIPKANVARVRIFKNNEEVYVTNPSPKLPAFKPIADAIPNGISTLIPTEIPTATPTPEK